MAETKGPQSTSSIGDESPEDAGLGQLAWPQQELEGKTDGWVAGNLCLDSNLTVRLGLIASFF